MSNEYHSHPIVFELPSNLETKMENMVSETTHLYCRLDSAVDEMRNYTEELNDLSRSVTKFLHKYEDKIFEEKYNGPKTPMDYYKMLFEWYAANEKENREDIHTLLKIYQYDYRKTILVYENKKEITKNENQ